VIVYLAAQDIIEYLLATTGGGVQDSEHRALRAAAANGYRDLVHAHNWKWHDSSLAIPAGSLSSPPYEFLLPADCKNVDAIVPPDRTTPCVYTTHQEYLRLLSYDTSPGSTIWWTVVRSSERPDRLKLLLGGRTAPVYATDSYLLSYRRKPAPLKYMGYEKVCRDGSQPPQGTVLRYGTSTQFPEGQYGVHPFTAEEIVGTAGSLVGTPPEGARTVFSDLLDVGEYMISALLSGAEAWYARLTGKNVEGAMTVHLRDMRMAMEQDGAAPMAGRRTHVLRYPENIEMPYGSTGTARSLGYYSPSSQDGGNVVANP
jgi:hypothetical protein